MIDVWNASFRQVLNSCFILIYHWELSSLCTFLHMLCVHIFLFKILVCQIVIVVMLVINRAKDQLNGTRDVSPDSIIFGGGSGSCLVTSASFRFECLLRGFRCPMCCFSHLSNTSRSQVPLIFQRKFKFSLWYFIDMTRLKWYYILFLWALHAIVILLYIQMW